VRGTVKTVAALGIAALLAAGCAKPATSTVATHAKFLACMVTDIGGINDHSFNQTSWQGMTEAATANPNVTVKYLQSSSSADYATNISQFEKEHCGVIVTVGFLMGQATQSAAAAAPHQKFAIVDCAYLTFCLPTKPGGKLHNINQLLFNTVQDGFLGGYLAAGMTKTGVVATYGGAKFGTVTIYEDGFWDGVQYYNKQHGTHVKVLGWNEPKQSGVFVTGASNPFNAQSQGAAIANTFINQHADIIFPVAGGTGLGSAAAIQTADKAGKHVYMYWVDTDGCISDAKDCSIYITSVEKGLATAVKGAVLSAASGHTGGIYVGTLANGGAVLAPFHAPWSTNVPAKLQSELKTVEQGIINGTIATPTKNPV
jgi:basic membrane protein A and related proteins